MISLPKFNLPKISSGLSGVLNKVNPVHTPATAHVPTYHPTAPTGTISTHVAPPANHGTAAPTFVPAANHGGAAPANVGGLTHPANQLVPNAAPGIHTTGGAAGAPHGSGIDLPPINTTSPIGANHASTATNPTGLPDHGQSTQINTVEHVDAGGGKGGILGSGISFGEAVTIGGTLGTLGLTAWQMKEMSDQNAQAIQAQADMISKQDEQADKALAAQEQMADKQMEMSIILQYGEEDGKQMIQALKNLGYLGGSSDHGGNSLTTTELDMSSVQSAGNQVDDGQPSTRSFLQSYLDQGQYAANGTQTTAMDGYADHGQLDGKDVLVMPHSLDMYQS